MIFYQRRFDIPDMRAVHIEINRLLTLAKNPYLMFNISMLNKKFAPCHTFPEVNKSAPLAMVRQKCLPAHKQGANCIVTFLILLHRTII